MEKKLYRDEQRKTIGGVCAGLAEYFNVDVSVVRVVFVLCLLLKGIGFLPYIVLWIVLPKKPYGFTNPNAGFNPGVDYTNFNPNFTNPFNTGKVDYSVPPPLAGQGQPFAPAPPKKSAAGLIFGVVLIVLGGIFLLDEFDIFPDFDFEKTWPVILVAIGAMLIFTGQKKEACQKHGWKTPADADGKVTDATVEGSDVDKKDDHTNSTTL
ncbi:PspC domain-containing protein [Mucilaginibacter sp.]|uniref:PspC domain-containing protein n=1 Tax=Mucilaginibacter sp. TaxID=1882438 RepID=UPI0035BC6BEF